MSALPSDLVSKHSTEFVAIQHVDWLASVPLVAPVAPVDRVAPVAPGAACC